MARIADREGFRERKLKRDVLALIVAHGAGGLELGPEIELALVPGGLGIVEGVGRARARSALVVWVLSRYGGISRMPSD